MCCVGSETVDLLRSCPRSEVDEHRELLREIPGNEGLSSCRMDGKFVLTGVQYPDGVIGVTQLPGAEGGPLGSKYEELLFRLRFKCKFGFMVFISGIGN